jgi:hypothetical protein
VKHLIKGFLIIVIISTSCEKLELKHDLVGTWKHFGIAGGVSGGGSVRYNSLILKKEDEYQMIRHDTIIEDGTYRISKNDLNFYNSYCSYKIRFNQESSLGRSADQLESYELLIQMISQDTLALYEPYYDGFDYYYARQ